MKVWHWDGFWGYFTNLYLLQGALFTVFLTAVTLVLGLVLAFGVTAMQMSPSRWVSTISRLYVWIFRGTPLLVQLIIIYTGLPQLGLGRFSVLESALLGLVLNEAAYLSEILRSGLLAVPRGQRDAARSLGLSRIKTFWLVVMPQAMRVIVPPLGNSVNGLLKTTSITSVISLEELLRRGQILMQQRFEVLEVFCVVAVIYLVLTSIWDAIQRRIEAHYGRAYNDIGRGQLAREAR